MLDDDEDNDDETTTTTECIEGHNGRIQELAEQLGQLLSQQDSQSKKTD